MKNYIRVILGPRSVYAQECFAGNFIGAHYINHNLTHELTENWRDFNAKFREVWMQQNQNSSKIAAGLACGMLWTVCKGIKIGDIVLCPDGNGNYRIGEITSEYRHVANSDLPHQRTVQWYPVQIARSEMSQELRNSTGSIGTISDVTQYAEEIERWIGNQRPAVIFATDSSIEDPSVFALEKHLEDFLVQNWAQTELGKLYDIYSLDGELLGQQYPSDTGPIDILAISKDQQTLLVVELKKGRASDAVVGQVQRYMGFVKSELAEPNQTVRGVIIALEDDIRIKRALSVTQAIEFYRYEVSFKLHKSC